MRKILGLGLVAMVFMVVFGLIDREKVTQKQLEVQDYSGSSLQSLENNLEDHGVYFLQVGDQTLEVEVVNTPSSITQGLSGRESIGADGLLFIFPSPGERRFWMKEMKFDLDLIWISQGEILEITPNIPKPDPNTPLSELPTYGPSGLVDMVLEIPSGRAKELKLFPGQEVVLK